MVLVRLDTVDEAELRELVVEAWEARAPARLRPRHVTPLVGVWLDRAFHFCTGAYERKARNLARNPHVVVTTGRNSWAEGVDIVVEGAAVRVIADADLHRIADAYRAKYGDAWDFQVRGDEFVQGDDAGGHVFRVAATTAFAFGKGPFSQTRYTF